MTGGRAVRRFGDSALRVEASSMDEAHGLAWAIELQEWPGVDEVVVGHRSVTIIGDPARAPFDELAGLAEDLAPAERGNRSPRMIEIPVVFDGPDLEEVALRAGLTPAGVVEAMVERELVVAMVGFVPGFGYLVGLPEPLAAVPRRTTPRPRVATGSVALGGGYAGVYPVATPGGWQVVGHSGTSLFDRDSAPFAVLRPADRVRFRQVESVESRIDRPRPALTASGLPSLRVLRPGALTTVQDRGRIGLAALGVPRAGAADDLSARLANRAVGNGDEAALLEMTLHGATLAFGATRCLALVGDAALSIGGAAVAPGVVHPVVAGQVVEVGPIGPGPRAYLAVAGGVDCPRTLSSRSSDLLCGLGPGPLAAGDELGLGEAGRARGRFEVPERGTTLRVLRGPDAVDDEVWGRIESGSYLVGERSDRTGVRLEPETPLPVVKTVVGSVAMVTGAVQLPQDGHLIVLGVDHATLGGYPVVATVVNADLRRLGQLRPGDEVRLEVVDLARAGRVRHEREAWLGRSLQGWYPVEAG